MNLIILDTETTGTKEEDRICQLSFLVNDEENEILEINDTFCTPPLPIKFDAMAVHHITPEMIEGSPTLQNTKEFEKLNELNMDNNILVIHNAQFDIEMLFREDFANDMRVLDTFRVLKHLYPNGRHGLQHNRYSMGLYKLEKDIEAKYDLSIQAHDSLGDVIVLKLLLDELLKTKSLEEMITLTQTPILYEKFYNGKYRNELISETILKDPEYIDATLQFENLDFDLRYSINYYLEELKDEIIYKFTVGKHKGKTPGEIAQIDFQYLKWAYDNMKMSKGLKMEIEKVLNL
jgi:exodeoxyribonuclease X